MSGNYREDSKRNYRPTSSGRMALESVNPKGFRARSRTLPPEGANLIKKNQYKQTFLITNWFNTLIC